MSLAPVILFVYNRPKHTKRTVEALQQNILAKESDLYIFADGAKNEEHHDGLNEVRQYIHQITGFKSVTICESKKNNGLAASVIAGLDKVMSLHGKAIVLEDDIVTSKYFLSFLNNALDIYEKDENVATISGYVPPMGKVKENFFLEQGSSWGWASWKRVWDTFEPDANKLIQELRRRKLLSRFDCDDSFNYMAMLQAQAKGWIDSWAIRFYASVFLSNKLCYYPKSSLVSNIGFDNSGTHCQEKDSVFNTSFSNVEIKAVRQKIMVSHKYHKMFRAFMKKGNPMPLKPSPKLFYKTEKLEKVIYHILGVKFALKRAATMKILRKETKKNKRIYYFMGIKLTLNNKLPVKTEEKKEIPLMAKFPLFKNNKLLEQEKRNKRICFEDIQDKDNLKNVHRVSFMLSNLCNYASFHKKCPLSKMKNKEIMPSSLVYKMIDELAQHKFSGTIAFHVYNEPMIDPRLFMFIKYVKEKCPQAIVFMTSNGYYIEKTMFEELVEIGVDSILVSAYSPAEYERLLALNNDKIAYCVYPAVLDDRMCQYEAPKLNLKKACFAPLNEICIAPSGEMFLCCLDWQIKHTFGDLKNNSLQDIVNSHQVKKVYGNLIQGKRCLHLCERCDWSR